MTCNLMHHMLVEASSRQPVRSYLWRSTCISRWCTKAHIFTIYNRSRDSKKNYIMCSSEAHEGKWHMKHRINLNSDRYWKLWFSICAKIWNFRSGCACFIVQCLCAMSSNSGTFTIDIAQSGLVSRLLQPSTYIIVSQATEERERRRILDGWKLNKNEARYEMLSCCIVDVRLSELYSYIYFISNPTASFTCSDVRLGSLAPLFSLSSLRLVNYEI